MDYTKILRHPATVPAVIGVLSFGGGLAAGIFLGRRQVQEDAAQKVIALGEAYDEALEEKGISRKVVIDEDHPALTEPKREMTATEYLEKRIRDGLDAAMNVSDPPIEPVTVNVFPVSDWDYEAEKRNRDSREPYILHRDEFFAEEMGLKHKTLIFYAGDNTLITDEQPHQVLYNWTEVVGELKFGHGSGEDHVVYIRNEFRSEEYEVLREEGSYEIARQGLEPEDGIQHSSLPKFRPPKE